MIVGSLLSPDFELGSLDIRISNERCNVSARLWFDPDIRTSNEDLDLVLEEELLPIDYNDTTARVTLNESHFREIMEEEEIRIKGSTDARPLPFWKMTRDIDEKVDLSFISDLVDSIEISNIGIDRGGSGGLKLTFDLTAEIEKDVSIIIENTEALLYTGTVEHIVEIVDLRISSKETGIGEVEMDTSTFLSAALAPDDLRIDAWGIEVDFVLPLDL